MHVDLYVSVFSVAESVNEFKEPRLAAPWKFVKLLLELE